MHWRFREMTRGEVSVDPVHDEFFKAQDLADALVRETIQNSLDARRGRSTVRVRFRFATGSHAISRADAGRWIADLLPHVEAAAGAMRVEIPAAGAPLDYLVVEDFGTRGLTGDPEVHPDVDDAAAERNDFHFFWRNVGRSMKGEVDRGRWGLGKAVFSVASKVHSIFGLTRRHDDDRTLLMGQSVLKIHSIDGRRFDPYGFYARIGRDGFAMPLEDASTLARFARDFAIERDEPGLSVVVPWPRLDELPFGAIVQSVIRQYFYPIARGDLAVEIADPVRSEMLTSRTLDEAAARWAADPAAGGASAKLCDLAKWAAVVPPEALVRLREQEEGAPKWSEELAAPADLEDLRERFDRGERLAIEIPVAVRRKGGRRAASQFRIFLEKDEAMGKGEHHFIRRGITIPGIRTDRKRAVRGLVVIDDDPLATLLGDAENPAHSDWSERADKVRLLYEYGATTVRFVRGSLPNLIAILARPPAGRFRDLLADVFSIDAGPGDDGASAAREEQADGAESAPEGAGGPPRPARVAGVTVVPTRDGFAIRRTNGRSDPELWRVEAAYRVRSGNPFRRWDRRDFALDREPIRVKSQGVAIRRVDGNVMEIEMGIEKASLEVTGFDPHRDLVVKLDPIEADAEETELH